MLRALNKDSLTTKIPVVVLSSLSQKTEARLQKEGAAAYFEKSKLGLDSQSLIQVVIEALAQRHTSVN